MARPLVQRWTAEDRAAHNVRRTARRERAPRWQRSGWFEQGRKLYARTREKGQKPAGIGSKTQSAARPPSTPSTPSFTYSVAGGASARRGAAEYGVLRELPAV